MKRVLLGLIAVLLMAYPFVVYFGLQYFDARFIGFVLLALVSARFVLAKKQLAKENYKLIVPATAASALIAVAVIFTDSQTMIRFNPVLINGVMLGLFAASLYHPPTMIERFARITDPDLPDEAIEYTRHVTMAWCVLFCINGLAGAYTAIWSSMEVWTLYNGLIAYFLMGGLFVVEYFVRCYKRRVK